MIARTRANTAAAQKPLVANPSRRLSTRSTIRTLMMRDTRPSVTQLRGAVMSFRRRPTVALTRPKTTATKSAIRNPSTSTPGTRYAAAKTARPERRREMRNFILKKLRSRKDHYTSPIYLSRKFALKYFSLQSLYAVRADTTLSESH